jgi:hypothetical protein
VQDVTKCGKCSKTRFKYMINAANDVSDHWKYIPGR